MRLIDQEELFKKLNQASVEKQTFMKARDIIRNTHPIEAIPKADYENRLKADMVAMLTEIQLEIEELRAKKHFQYKHGQEHGLNNASGIIQGKINGLKENEDENNSY